MVLIIFYSTSAEEMKEIQLQKGTHSYMCTIMDGHMTETGDKGRIFLVSCGRCGIGSNHSLVDVDIVALLDVVAEEEDASGAAAGQECMCGLVILWAVSGTAMAARSPLSAPSSVLVSTLVRCLLLENDLPRLAGLDFLRVFVDRKSVV